MKKLKLTEIFNTHNINTVENSWSIPPRTVGNHDEGILMTR